jgi:dihydrofolate reductase
MLIGIVAISKNFAIGRGGALPWHYSADLKFFREMTTGHAIVMGYNTWRSIGRALPNRRNIVLSRKHGLDAGSGAELCRDRNEIVELARRSDVFVIGGAALYREFSPEIERWIVTEIPIDVDDADTFLPVGTLDDFCLLESRGIGDGLIAKTYQRRANGV